MQGTAARRSFYDPIKGLWLKKKNGRGALSTHVVVIGVNQLGSKEGRRKVVDRLSERQAALNQFPASTRPVPRSLEVNSSWRKCQDPKWNGTLPNSEETGLTTTRSGHGSIGGSSMHRERGQKPKRMAP